MSRLLLCCLTFCWLTNWARPATSADDAVRALTQRLLPERADEFSFEAISPDDGHDVFEIEGSGGRVTIRGNTGIAMAVGLNWYLKHYCRAQVSWYGNQLELPKLLPPVVPPLRRHSWARYRYFLNYCCFGYSLPWWDWSQWERLIDWMALNGVNAPLAVTGQEAVWQAVCRELEFSEDEIAAFLAGPPYLPFSWMGCLDGWGGPLPESWIRSHEELGRQILDRERALGMTPVLQGFTGHVPAAVATHFPDAKLHRIRWIEWQTHLLDPLDELYPRIAALFMAEQQKRFGGSHLYAADTFIEMTPPSGDPGFLTALSKAIYLGLASSDAEAIWVLQGWTFMNQRRFWTQPRIRAFLDAVPNDRMLVLDLFCENTPMWSRTEAFCGKPWLWCNVQNFGRTVHLGGALDRNNHGLMAARTDPKRGRLAGLGFVNEGLGYNPVAYDLMYEMAWRDQAVDLPEWLRDYSWQRYGQTDRHAAAAWEILGKTVYTAPHRTRSIIDCAPRLTPAGAVPYDNADLAEAWRQLLASADVLGGRDPFRFDLVNVGRQVLSNHAADLHARLIAAHRVGDADAFRTAADAFLALMDDLDRLLATRSEFLLGRWLADARRWGATDAERARFEWNARRVLTLWGAGTRIDDYARKEWSGMISGYYRKRWAWYLDEVHKSMVGGHPFDAGAFSKELRRWMAEWSASREAVPTGPVGDSIAVSRALWQHYGKAFAPDALSLTTGKPVSCSAALPPYPARLANDGRANNTDRYWAMDVRRGDPAWWEVDLEEATPVGRIVVVGYYGDARYYSFTVETSLDGKRWDLVADRRDNHELSTRAGYTCRFEPRPVRYIRVTETHNSANTGRHLVEVMAFAK